MVGPTKHISIGFKLEARLPPGVRPCDDYKLSCRLVPCTPSCHMAHHGTKSCPVSSGLRRGRCPDKAVAVLHEVLDAADHISVPVIRPQQK